MVLLGLCLHIYQARLLGLAGGGFDQLNVILMSIAEQFGSQFFLGKLP